MVIKLDLEQNNVLALRIEGELDHESFMEVVKDMEEEFEDQDHFRLYLEVPELEHVEFRTIWDSLKFALTHFRQYVKQIDRIAVVSDEKWLRWVTEVENKLMPSISEKAFTFAEVELAREWIKEFTPDLIM